MRKVSAASQFPILFSQPAGLASPINIPANERFAADLSAELGGVQGSTWDGLVEWGGGNPSYFNL